MSHRLRLAGASRFPRKGVEREHFTTRSRAAKEWCALSHAAAMDSSSATAVLRQRPLPSCDASAGELAGAVRQAWEDGVWLIFAKS